MSERAGWGILGTGGIARTFAAAVQCLVVGAPGRRWQSRGRPGERHSVGSSAPSGATGRTRPSSLTRMSSSSTSGPLTRRTSSWPWPPSRRASTSCARSRSRSTRQGAEQIVAAARRSGTFMMEAFAFRVHPQTSRLIELLDADEIGEVRSVRATFGFDAGPSPTNYLLRPDLAGGAMLDNGCYPVALTRRIAGQVVGRPFADPERVFGAGLLHAPTGVDLDASALTWYQGGFSAQIQCTIRTEVDKVVVITGSRIHPAARCLPAWSSRQVWRNAAHHHRAARREPPARSWCPRPGLSTRSRRTRWSNAHAPG